MGRRRNFHTTGIFSYLVKSHKNLVQCFVKAKQIIIILLRITICKVTNNITNISDVTLLIRASESTTLYSKIKKNVQCFFFGKGGDCHNFSQTSEINDFYLKIFLKRRFPNFGVVLIQ